MDPHIYPSGMLLVPERAAWSWLGVYDVEGAQDQGEDHPEQYQRGVDDLH